MGGLSGLEQSGKAVWRRRYKVNKMWEDREGEALEEPDSGDSGGGGQM